MNAVTQGELLRALPYARRYARALAGGQEAGDRLVAEALRAGLPQVPGHLALYAGVTARVAEGEGQQGGERGGGTMGLRQRQLLLLTALEDLPIRDAALVVGMEQPEAEAELEAAHSVLRATAATDVLVIEDEPIIAMDIRQLVEGCGHHVVGMASDETEAVELARSLRPGLILADVNLGPGGDGITAVERILGEQKIPVIFVTAYPERLLTAERLEPAFIISKPFEPVALAIATYQAVSGGVRLS
ncbi:Two-component response regulator [Roseomonas mucosa]|uniref:Response regulator n=1 Tax=Roseomonas mucosa TaxID=207340 RepID=A0A1S8D1J1_9PROT|nr:MULTISPECIES: response regulator [Roseomonas]MDT8263233.1 response regulator [Roseomonas sp. DSM 102946]ATR20564.1 response regulator [Roseomonas sp. FDAARGOS_362]AWV23334.1 Two-component response regulator [Roseomonas mucosa]MDT8277683.1 response regulator [Roseomonas mucosa]MDT8353489.1 response regulator [Roseomonas mucosa]